MIKKTLKKLIGRPGLLAYHASKSHLAAHLSGKPARNMRVIGVTGTNGKTTTCNIIAGIFEKAGYKVALCTTIQFRINGVEVPNEFKMTMLEPFALNRFLKKAQEAGCEILVIEVTSIGLDQQRFAGITFDTGVFTNLTHDHLDYHGTLDEYAKAKRKLFALGLRASVINIDDPMGVEYNKERADLHVPYSLTNTNVLHSTRSKQKGILTEFTAQFPDGRAIELETALPGSFNIANILAAVGVAYAFGIRDEVIQQGVASVSQVAGRMERVEVGQDFAVIIDYAHTPDALTKMYEALKTLAKGHRIISVLGSCGDRDRQKRPILGAIAGSFADYVIITNEDPYTEDPMSIINAVASGVPSGTKHLEEEVGFWKILDRREAIKKAITLAQPGDIITITGKGAETAMVFGTTFVPWSDSRVAEEELRQALSK